MEIKDLSYYFDLSSFAHADIFKDMEYIFDVFKVLPTYVEKHLKPEIRGTVMDGAFVGDNVFLDEGSVVQPGAWVRGPAIIGKNCEIRHGAFVGANVVCGDHAVIGHATEVGNTIMFNNARAPHFAFVGHSILGNNVNLGAGTKLSNLKITSQNISLEGVDTGLQKLGAIIGDGSSLGCNTVTQPGTFLGKKVHCYPNMLLRGFVPSGTLLKLRQNQEAAELR